MRKLSLYLSRIGLYLGLLRRRIVAIFEHQNIKRILGSNLAFVLIASSIVPATSAADFGQEVPEESVISVSQTLQDSLKTEVKIHYPIQKVVINQGFSFFHPGIDFGANSGEPVNPMKAGIVIAAGWDFTGYGNKVIIDHGGGIETLYAHLAKIEVKTGDAVEPFTEIGRVGITGRTTGPHLHFEVHGNGITINPFSILPKID